MLKLLTYFFAWNKYEVMTFLLALPEIKNYSGEEEARVLIRVLNNYEINADKLRWFILDNTSNY